MYLTEVGVYATPVDTGGFIVLLRTLDAAFEVVLYRSSCSCPGCILHTNRCLLHRVFDCME